MKKTDAKSQALIQSAQRMIQGRRLKLHQAQLEVIYAGAILALQQAHTMADEVQACALLEFAHVHRYPLASSAKALAAFYGIGQAVSFEKAQALLEQSFSDAPDASNDGELWYHLYLIYKQTGPQDKQTALALERALQLKPGEPALAPLWEELAEHPHTLEASWQRYCYAKALNLSSEINNRAHLYFKLGQNYERGGKSDEARNCYQTCVTLVPEHKAYVHAWAFLARAYLSEPKAHDLLKAAIDKILNLCTQEPNALSSWQILKDFYQQNTDLPKDNWIVLQCQHKIAVLNQKASVSGRVSNKKHRLNF